MKKFHVTLERSAVEYLTLEVEAEDEDTATEKAMLRAKEPDYDDGNDVIDYHMSGDDESTWDVSYAEVIETDRQARRRQDRRVRPR